MIKRVGNFIYYEKLEDYEEQVKKAKLCDEKDKEIERLNEELKQAKETVLNEHKYASEIEDKNITTNNIINELEKWIKEILLSKAYSIGYKEAYKDIYMKLQELKGSSNNE